MKQQKKLWVMAAILFIICGACVITCTQKNATLAFDTFRAGGLFK